LNSPADRSAFHTELQECIQKLAEKYGARQDSPPHPKDVYRLILACYPTQLKE